MTEKVEADNRLNTYPVVDLNMEGVETEGQKHIVWENEREKRSLAYIVLGGGDWQGIWTKILILTSSDPLVGTDLMRVEISKDNDTGRITKAVFVDAFKYDGGKGVSANFVYDLDNDGKREESGHVRQISEADIEDYFEVLKYERVRTYADLPDRIDVEETIRLFLEQIEERRMSLPVLVEV